MSMIPKLWSTNNQSVGVSPDTSQPALPEGVDTQTTITSRPGDPEPAPTSDGGSIFSTDPLA